LPLEGVDASSISMRLGDGVRTDRRGAMTLARLAHTGELAVRHGPQPVAGARHIVATLHNRALPARDPDHL
jgi:hypothetical protein